MYSVDIPYVPAKDSIMARQSEISEISNWTHDAFSGKNADKSKNDLQIEVIRQDYNTLHYGLSCMDTPIKIGTTTYNHGLGTHANSVIKVVLPTGAKSFESSVGVDNNYDTQGIHGSVQFSIEINGKEVIRTATLHGGDQPVKVKVDIPDGVSELVLKVDATADGPAYDQSDWADAKLVMKNGSVRFLDENAPNYLLTQANPPFSFTYDGKLSSDFISKWHFTVTSSRKNDWTEYVGKWTDPVTGLVVTAQAKAFKEYPAVDWLLYFENTGKSDTPIIEDIRTIDICLETGNARLPVVLHQLHGDACNEMSFQPYDTNLEAGKYITIAPARGRPSQETAFPFWNLQYGDRGVITAVGWSGQWSATFNRNNAGPTTFKMGMEKTHLLLYPGETIRTPRVLIMPWKGDKQEAHNRFRRLMMFQYVPKQGKKPLRLPVALQTFDRYISTSDWATEAGQLKAVEAAHKLGCDSYWFDAGWFVGGFPNGAGNWFTKPKEFPNGLKPISDRCHKYGMQFIIWFEPCRVAPGTQIADEHPQFVFGGKNGGLYNLGNPDALKWITDLISKRITEYGIDVYREDYNIDPQAYWHMDEADNRQGMNEIRFVEGHYAFWDELLKRHPGLWIDNCASGGRRIDLETCMRSVPLWRSDTNCASGHPEWAQMQSAALGMYIPLHTGCCWEPERYKLRSTGTGGALIQFAYQDKNFPWEEAIKVLDEAKEDQHYWYGDFYPLTAVNTDQSQFMAYQFHRSDLDEGLVLAFRRADCDFRGLILDLKALKSGTSYNFVYIDEKGKKTKKTMTGKQVAASGFELNIPGKAQSLVVRYKAQAK